MEYNRVELDWRRPYHDGNCDIENFIIEESRKGRWRELEGDTGDDDTEYAVTGLVTETTYHFRVRAENDEGESIPSAPVSATTLPTPPVHGYALERSVGGVNWAPLQAATEESGPHWDDADEVQAATTYQYRIQALNSGVKEAWSLPMPGSTRAALTLPGAPADLQVAPTADSRLHLTWTAPSDHGGRPIKGYCVERAPDKMPRVWTEVVANRICHQTSSILPGPVTSVSARSRIAYFCPELTDPTVE